MKFKPHEYQEYAIKFILDHPVSALFLDCGLGKTVCTLTALRTLLQTGGAKRALVVAPLRVARDVWPAEVKKWDHLKNLKVSVIVGNQKQRLAALDTKAQIYVINRENLQWLLGQRWTREAFDTVVLDELSSFKNFHSERSRAAFRICRSAERVIGLTGTPAANSLMDLWSEYRILDNGRRLGKYITDYQQKYFSAYFGFNNYITGWTLKTGAADKIYEAISDITISMKAMDHLVMPEKIVTDYPVRLSEKEMKQYERFSQEMALNLPGGDITAMNAMSLAQKLIQLSNGVAYGKDGTPLVIHDRKLEALEDLLEAANGKPVLVVCNYLHDRERIEKQLKEKAFSFARLDNSESIALWNAGKLQAGLINPMSAGHGLNLQDGGSRIIWYSLPWSLELYQQTNARLYRQGQKSDTVVIQHILTKETIDERIRAVLMKKDHTQNDLIDALKAEIIRQAVA